MRIHGFAAAAALVLAVPADAIIVTSFAGAPDPGILPDQAMVIDFDAPNAAGIASTTVGTVITAAGSIGGVRAEPAGDRSIYQSIGSGGSSTFDFLGFAGGRSLGSFSLYWGSVDRYNHIDFYNRIGQLAATFDGSSLPRFDGNQSASATNRRVNFGFSKSEDITRVRLRSDSPAFEFDDIGVSAAVPEPASWATMIIGFGMIGYAARRRQAAAPAV